MSDRSNVTQGDGGDLGVLFALALLLLSAGIVLGPDFLRALHFDPTRPLADPSLVHGIRIALIASSVLLLTFGRSHAVQVLVVRPFTRLGNAGVAVLLVATSLLVIEGLSFLVFSHGISERRRTRALAAIGAAELPRDRVPFFVPYLWSNYAPNPRSTQVNEHGWRYGGGEKKAATRILCLGGSTTWSSEVDRGELSYPARMEEHLRESGYDVDVVNGGVSYHSSAEVVGTLAFRGVHTDPDVIVIHTGGNDMEPLMAPGPYRADYSHWRSAPTIGKPDRETLFRAYWSAPSWTVRLMATEWLRPRGVGAHALGEQRFESETVLFEGVDPAGVEPIGLEMNLRTIIATARGVGARPVVVLFRSDPFHPNAITQRAQGRSADEIDAANRRWAIAGEKVNATMERVARESRVPIIRFDAWEPSHPQRWVDHCHLDAEGVREKGIFIGDALVAAGVL